MSGSVFGASAFAGGLEQGQLRGGLARLLLGLGCGLRLGLLDDEVRFGQVAELEFGLALGAGGHLGAGRDPALVHLAGEFALGTDYLHCHSLKDMKFNR